MLNQEYNAYAGFQGMPFYRFIETAANGKWTGVVHIVWNDNNLAEAFRGVELEKMRMRNAYLILNEGIITQALFSRTLSPEMIDQKLALDNLLLLLRAFEGLGGHSKKDGMAFFKQAPEAANFPNTLDVNGKNILSYSLLAEEQARKSKCSH